MVSQPASRLGSLEALRAQLSAPAAAADSPRPDAATLADEFLLCHCTNVTAGEVREVIQSGEATSFDDVQRCTRAGDGCGKCVPLLGDLVVVELNKVTTR